MIYCHLLLQVKAGVLKSEDQKGVCRSIREHLDIAQHKQKLRHIHQVKEEGGKEKEEKEKEREKEKEKEKEKANEKPQLMVPVAPPEVQEGETVLPVQF